MKKRFISILFLGALALVGACGEDPAAETTGSIEGVIYSFQSGDIVPRAHVFTEPPSSSVTTDSVSGIFKIDHVEPGVYRIIAQKTGFDSSSVSVSVLEGEKTIADLALRVDTTKTDSVNIN